MRYFYYGKDTEGKILSGRKNNAELQSSTVEKKTYVEEFELVIEEDTIYEVDRMCLSRRQGEKFRKTE